MPEEEDVPMDPDPATRQALIDRYRDGYREVMDAVRDISPEELDARSGPSEWSARQVVHHLADSEMTSAIRLRRLIAEENPQIVGYDEKGFAERLHYDRPIEVSLDTLRAARASTAEILGSPRLSGHARASTPRSARTAWRPGSRPTRRTRTSTRSRSAVPEVLADSRSSSGRSGARAEDRATRSTGGLIHEYKLVAA